MVGAHRFPVFATVVYLGDIVSPKCVNMSSKRRVLLLGTMAFFVGMGVMAIEITASRILAPHFGASLFVWTSLIVTVLLALSAGYWIGGIVAEKRGNMQTLGILLAASSGFLLIGLWMVKSFALSLSSIIFGWSNASLALFLGSLATSFFAFAIPVFMLAVASPIIVKLWTEIDGHVGRVTGRYFAISTIGSVVGTIAPTLILVPMLGAFMTLVVVSASLFVVSVITLSGRERIIALVVVGVLLGVTANIQQDREQNIVYEKESPYQLIRVIDYSAEQRAITFNEGLGIQSVSIPASGRTGYYYDHFAAVPFLHGDRAEKHSVVILGLAGGTAARQYTSQLSESADISMTGVEVDKEVIVAAERYMDLGEIDIDIVIMDARMYLRQTEKKFDTIILDAFSVQLYIPSHLVTKEFFSLAHESLQEGGILVMNVNASERTSPLLEGITNSVATAFSHVYVIKVKDGFWNYLVLASEKELDLDAAASELSADFWDIANIWRTKSETVVYDKNKFAFTDDKAPVEFMTENMILTSMLK